MSGINGTGVALDDVEAEGVYVLLTEALSDIAADVPWDAAGCIERALTALRVA